MRSTVVVFPFDLFGGAGCAAGAMLLADAIEEMLHDTRLEPLPVRQKAFHQSLAIEEVEFDTIEALNNWRDAGRTAFDDHYDPDGFTLWLSGNHLGVLPVYEHLPKSTTIVQFDAHLDCFDLHDTHATLSHGNFLREVKRDLVNIGHRDLFLTEAAIRKHFRDAYPAETLDAAVVAKRLTKLKDIWIDIDVDVFDPGVCPAVHSPVPLGLGGLQMLSVLNALDWSRVRGVSVSEYDPGRDVRDTSLNLLGWLVEWMLLKKHERK